MGLWFYDETAPFAFNLADELTEIRALLIARGAMDEAPERPPAVVVDFAAYRRARFGERGPDA